MSERLKLIPPILLAASMAFAPQVNAQDTPRLPSRCYTNGLPDASICHTEIVTSPYMYQIMRHGYIDGLGIKQNRLPSNDLDFYNAGNYLTGNLLYIDDGYMNEVRRQSEDLGIDPNQFIGAFASDSCFYKHMAAWIRPYGSTEPFTGKLFVMDCRAIYDKLGANTIYASVGEVNKSIFQRFQQTGLLRAEVVFSPIDSPAPDPSLNVNDAVDYPSTWCQEARNYCHDTD